MLGLCGGRVRCRRLRMLKIHAFTSTLILNCVDSAQNNLQVNSLLGSRVSGLTALAHRPRAPLSATPRAKPKEAPKVTARP